MPTPTTPKPPTTKAPAALSSAERRNLRARAHHLEPVVHVGHHGVTDAVLKEVAEQLLAHELIKVRLHEPEDKQAMADALSAGTGASLCGLVGHTAILYKKHPKQPRSFKPEQLDKPKKPKKKGGRKKGGRKKTGRKKAGTSRQR
jgi:RNA-binding protein